MGKADGPSQMLGRSCSQLQGPELNPSLAVLILANKKPF